MFIFYGVYKKARALGERIQMCVAKGCPAKVHYIHIRRTFYLMFIPLFPAGSKTYAVCGACGKQWNPSNAPSDAGFLGMAVVNTLLLFSFIGCFLYFAFTYPIPNWICGPSFILIGLMVLVAAIFMFSTPGGFGNYPGTRPEQLSPHPDVPRTYSLPPVTIYPSQPAPAYQSAPQQSYYQQPPAPSQGTSDQGSALRYQEGGYYQENLCPHCGRPLPQVPRGMVITCNYCRNQIAT